MSLLLCLIQTVWCTDDTVEPQSNWMIRICCSLLCFGIYGVNALDFCQIQSKYISSCAWKCSKSTPAYHSSLYETQCAFEYLTRLLAEFPSCAFPHQNFIKLSWTNWRFKNFTPTSNENDSVNHEVASISELLGAEHTWFLSNETSTGLNNNFFLHSIQCRSERMTFIQMHILF